MAAEDIPVDFQTLITIGPQPVSNQEEPNASRRKDSLVEKSALRGVLRREPRVGRGGGSRTHELRVAAWSGPPGLLSERPQRRLNITINDEAVMALEEYAEKHRVSLAEAVRRLVDAGLSVDDVQTEAKDAKGDETPSV